MKKINILKPIVCCLCLLLFLEVSFAAGPPAWTVKFEPEKVFIENRGQFKINEVSGFNSHVQYAYDGNIQNYYFTKSGVIFQLRDTHKPKENKKEEAEARERKEKGNAMTPEEHAKEEREERRRIIIKDELRAQWVGANPDVQIQAEGKHSAYHSYSFTDQEGKLINENEIPGFDKITYKDLYPNIDVVYIIHPDGGIKYSILVHPGGDISKVKLRYSKKARLLADGDIKTKSRFGDFTDHAPATFYQDDKTPVASSYVLADNVISFSVGQYDPTKTIVIDPWTQTPAFAGSGGWQCVWECQRDAASNVYVIGGVSPMILQKYNPTGALQWSYNTPWDTANDWLGTFAVDNAGNSYVTDGTAVAIQKISTAGALVWSNLNPVPTILLGEFWSISFNCDQTQLVIGGTSGSLFPQPEIYNVDVATGAVLNYVQVTGGSLTLPQEVRAITAARNGNYYFLTHDSIGYIHQGLTTCSTFPFHTSNSYNFAYKCEDFREDNTGIKAIKAFGAYVYTHRGDEVHKRLFNSGGIVATGAVPNGGFTTTLGMGQVSNSGIDIDSCGNVYVGSANEVVEFNSNLTQIATFPTSSNFYVYDVQVLPNGNIIAAGSSGNDNSGARTGYVETFAAGACTTIATICCDASITCSQLSACSNAAPFNLTAATPGGVWSGHGITSATNGTFSPAVAGVGTFTVYYTLPCGMDSATIVVNNCSSLSACRNTNGTVSVSGGSAPYTWYVYDSVGQVCNGIVIFGICAGTEVPVYGWTQFATGVTVTPPATTDTILVSDGGAGDTIYNISNLAVCSACNLAIQGITPTNPTCGASNGSATVNVTAGTGTTPYHYKWNRTAADTLVTISNLGAGTYTVTVTDAGGCTAVDSVTISPSGNISLLTSTDSAYCGHSNGKIFVTASGGTPAYTYVWSAGGSTTDSAVNLAANTYTVTVTDANHCSATVSATVAPAAGVVLSLASEHDVTCNGLSNGKIYVNAAGGAGPYTYTWSPNVSTKDSAVGLAPNVTYAVTVQDANNCTSSVSATVNQPTTINVSTSATQANCGVSNGTATVTASGGTGTLSYLWSAGTTPTAALDNGLPAGAYTVTVTDADQCTALGTAAVSDIGAPTALITSQVNERCNGGNTGKIVVSVSGGTQPYGYTWSPNVSTMDSAVGLTAATYSLTVNDATNCIAVLSATITQPTALTATMQSVNADCGISDGWAKVTGSGGTGSYTYTWSVPQFTDSITLLAAGTYYVTVSDSLGCQYADSAVVGTNQGPSAPTITPGPQVSICQGDSVVLTSSAATGNTWSNTATTQSITVYAAGTFTVTQTVGGCTSPPSASVVVILNPIPPAPVITPPTPIAICQGDSVILTSSASSGNLWSNNKTTKSIVVNSPGTFTVSDTVGGCPSPPSVPVVVSIIPGPQPVIIASQPSLCPGSGSVTLDATTASASAYQWNTSSTQPTITVTAAGFYQVTVTVNGCTGTDTITINAQPELGPLSLPDTSYICRGDTVVINATTTNATSYVWAGAGFTSTSPIVVLDSGGVYSVTVSNGCGSENGQTIVSLMDCECRIVMPNAFTPNGDNVNDYFLPNYDCNNPTSLLMRIFNRWGEKVFETTDLNGRWDGTYRGVMQPPGVYVYYVEFTGFANNVSKSFQLMGSLALIR